MVYWSRPSVCRPHFLFAIVSPDSRGETLPGHLWGPFTGTHSRTLFTGVLLATRLRGHLWGPFTGTLGNPLLGHGTRWNLKLILNLIRAATHSPPAPFVGMAGVVDHCESCLENLLRNHVYSEYFRRVVQEARINLSTGRPREHLGKIDPQFQ